MNIDQHFHTGFPIGIDILVSIVKLEERVYFADQRLEVDLTLFYQADRLYIIRMTVHHGGIQIQLVIIQNGQIYGCHIRKDGNQNDSTAFPRAGDGISYAVVVTGTVKDNIGFIRAKGVADGCFKGRGSCVHGKFQTAFLCFFDPEATNIRDQHTRCAYRFGGLSYQNANRARHQLRQH